MTEQNPVVDTLDLADALRGTGMPREQADGVARAIGGELAGRVPVKSDLEVVRSGLESKIEGVRGDLEVVRSDLEAKIEGVRGDLEVVRSDLEAKIEGIRGDLEVVRSDLEAKIDGVRGDLEAKIDGVRGDLKVVRADLEAKIESTRSDVRALGTKLNLFGIGVGLTLALLSVLVGLELFRPTAAVPAAPVSPITVNFPVPGSWAVPSGPTQAAPDAGEDHPADVSAGPR